MGQSQKLTDRESITIDLMKALSILSVIAAHVVSFDESSFSSKLITSFWKVFGEVGVIVFFVIGGFLYKRRIGDNKEFWKKKFFRIVLPWFFCSAITYILTVIISREWSLFSYVKWVLGSGTWYYYITIYTMFLFIFKIFYEKDAILYFLIGMQILSITLRTFGITTTYSFGFFTDYLNPFHWAGYFSLGILVRRYRIDLTLRRYFIVSVVSVAGLVMVASLFVLCYKKIFTYFHIISLVFCVSALVLISTFSYKMANLKIAPKIAKIGTYSYCIYLLHMQIVQGVCSKIPDSFFKFLFSPFVGLAIMLILIFLGLLICKSLSFGDKIKMIVGL